MRKVNRLEIDELEEVSGVDRPAQPGARALIFKREKPLAETDPSPVALTADQNTTPGEPEGSQETNMTDKTKEQEQAEAVTKALAPVQAELAVAKALAEFSDAEKALYRGMDAAGQEEFRKLSPAARLEKVRAATDADPVVFTSLDGESFRKSDDPRLAKLAKDRDEDRKQLLIEKAARQAERLAKRAAEEIPNLKGDANAKIALLKAVDTLTESERASVAEILKSANSAMAKVSETRGTSAASSVGEGAEAAEAKLEAMAKKHAETQKVTLAKAWDDILQTEEGRALYQETVA